MAGIGVGAALYQLTVTRAYRYARALITGGLLQLTLVFSLIYQWLVFDEGVSIRALLGIVLIAGSSALAVWATRNPKKLA